MLARIRATRASRIGLGCVFAATGILVGSQMASDSMRAFVLLSAAALVYLALFIWQPVVALLTYIAIRPAVDAFVFQQFRGFTLGELWGFGMVVSVCLFLVLESADKKEKMRLAVVPVAFLFFLAVLTVTRPELMTAVSTWMRVASWILVMLTCERISRDRRGQLMCWWAGIAMSATLIVAVGVMILQHRFGSTFYGDPLRNVSGQLPHPLSVGAVLLLPFALSGALIVGRRGLSLSIAAGLFAAIILSFVRTAYVGGLIVFGALLVVAARGRGTVRTFSIAAVLGVGVAVYAMWDRVSERFQDLALLSASSAAQQGAGSGRVGIWEAALSGSFDTVQHAIIGRGAGGPLEVMLEALRQHVGAHNDFLDFLLAGGLLLGVSYLVLLAWMVSSPLRILRDSTQSSRARGFAALTLGAVVAFIVMSMLNGLATYQPSIAVGLLVGLARGVMSTPGRTFLDPESSG